MIEQDIEHVCHVLTSKFPDRGLDFYKFGLAQEVLRILIDNEWANQAIFEQHSNKLPKTEEDRNYLKSPGHSYRWQERVFKLAERIYNLQNVIGISRIIREIKNGNLTSRYAELEAAKHLYCRNIPFEFVIPRGQKAADFDIKICGAAPTNCEIKHKIETTKLSGRTLLDSLESAYTQVPTTEPALFFIKIPEEWIKNPDIETTIDNVTRPFLKKNDNVLGIVFRWEIANPSRIGSFLWMYRFLKNKAFKNNPPYDVLVQEIQSDPINWISLEDLVNRYIF